MENLGQVRKKTKNLLVERLDGGVNRNCKIRVVIDKLNEVIEKINEIN